ncbi:type II toxin-antitoxin system RelE/ParE family toxin [Marimonas sp. MJW-29]|uniref:Toxin n=1 Tax=Sulfitobacter sediminis TaxID=3234186 RepID=A0ABV3RHJ0_9RHOB
MTSSYNVTSRAAADLDEIAAYTLNAWGEMQMEVYLRKIDERFTWLAENPDLGRKRDDITPGYRCFVEGSHAVFFLVRDGGIDVIGVLHQSRDVETSLRGRS